MTLNALSQMQFKRDPMGSPDTGIMAAPAAAAAVEITQLVVAGARVEQVVTERLHQDPLRKVVARAVREERQAFLASLLISLLAVVVALMVRGTAPMVLIVQCQLEQPVAGALRSVEMVEEKPRLVAVMVMEIAVTVRMAQQVRQILEVAAAVPVTGFMVVQVEVES
jgi:hypothetical protein